jgi:hypothetical protein
MTWPSLVNYCCGSAIFSVLSVWISWLAFRLVIRQHFCLKSVRLTTVFTLISYLSYCNQIEQIGNNGDHPELKVGMYVLKTEKCTRPSIRVRSTEYDRTELSQPKGPSLAPGGWIYSSTGCIN